MIRFDDLPSDPLLLKQKLIETTSIIAKVSAEKVALADERNVAIAQRNSALQENEKLLLILSQYKRAPVRPSIGEDGSRSIAIAVVWK
jgi:transposase